MSPYYDFTGSQVNFCQLEQNNALTLMFGLK